MRKMNVTLPLYEYGDRVYTPDGVGTVIENEPHFTDPYLRVDIKVKLDSSTGSNPNGIGEFDPANLSPLKG